MNWHEGVGNGSFLLQKGGTMPTSQIIVTSRFIRSDTKKSKARRANYTKYIATRETVEKRSQKNTAVTTNQTQLINELLKEFPIAKTYLEYEDYSAKPTTENASELISTIIERHADVIGNRKNFVDYMARIFPLTMTMRLSCPKNMLSVRRRMYLVTRSTAR